MSDQQDKPEKPPEQEAFTDALSLALSVSKQELQERLSKSAVYSDLWVSQVVCYPS